MELKWLKDFLALCEVGNFRVAAQQRYVSQPAFSRRIQSLEAWIEAPLINRSGKPSQLTQAGKLFYPIAQEIVDLADAGKEAVQTLIQEDKERMRFATLGTLAHIFMPIWLKSLQPFIEASQFVFKTEYNTVASYFAALEDGSFDFFVCYEDPKNGFQDGSEIFTSLTLGTEALVPVVCPNDKGEAIWWLPDCPEGPIPCLHTLSKQSPWPIRHHMETKYSDLTFRSVYESSGGTTLKAMALEGFGLAWIPITHVAEDLASGRLVRAAAQADDIIVDIKIYRCAKSDEPRVEKFWQALLKHNGQRSARAI